MKNTTNDIDEIIDNIKIDINEMSREINNDLHNAFCDANRDYYNTSYQMRIVENTIQISITCDVDKNTNAFTFQSYIMNAICEIDISNIERIDIEHNIDENNDNCDTHALMIYLQTI